MTLNKIFISVLLYLQCFSMAFAEDCSPNHTLPSILAAGLTVETFNQLNNQNKSVTRRYLAYIPSSVIDAGVDVPVVIVNHGSWNNAEMMRETTTAGFEDLADKAGFIVVYSNGLPNPDDKILPQCDDAATANRGWWREPMADSGKGSDNYVDDEEYFQMLLTDMQNKGWPVDRKNIFLTGISGGGNMALYAAIEHGERYRAVATIAAPGLFSASHIQGQQQIPLSLLVIYSAKDSLYTQLLKWEGYSAHVEETISEWAGVLGVDTTAVKIIDLPNTYHEGETYQGDNAAALATRNSSVSVQQYPRGKTGKRLLVYKIDHGGHAGGNPIQWPMETVNSPYALGFRNQDFTSSEVIWHFFEAELKQKKQ